MAFAVNRGRVFGCAEERQGLADGVKHSNTLDWCL